MRAIISAAIAVLIGVAALTLAHPGEDKQPPAAASSGSGAADLRSPIAQHVLQNSSVR